ncbi:MAG: hypothetical protein MUP80_05010 [Acidobacteriia bacterium]|nr:hypothetical protein [Terriglobia bacterium]
MTRGSKGKGLAGPISFIIASFWLCMGEAAQDQTPTGTGGGSVTPQVPAVTLKSPRSVAVDGKGNLFVAAQFDNRVLKLDARGQLTVIVGTGKKGFGGDGGPAVRALLSNPSGLAADPSGNLFIADWDNNRIRRVDAKTGTISTVAGNGKRGFDGDGGPATQASLSRPAGVETDQFGNLFIADTWNHRVRRVDAATGIITTVAGNGSREYAGDGGPAIDAGLGLFPDIALDKLGNLFIADNNNRRVRRIDATTHIITTVAGDGGLCYRGDGSLAKSTGLLNPSAVAFDADYNLFIAAGSWNTIHRVDSATGIMTTVAGNRLRRLAGDGGPAIQASLAVPTGIALDSAGNLYIADFSNHRVRRVDVDTGVITTVVGDENPGFSGDLVATDDEMKPFAPFFVEFSECLNRFTILKQHKISPEYAVTVVEGSAAREDVLCRGEKIDYSKRAADGIFIVSGAGKELSLVLDVFRGPWGTGLKILEADERTLTVSKQDETYGGESERVKYFYDLTSKKLTNKVSYHAMNVYSVVEFQGTLFFVGSADRESSILTKIDRDAKGAVTGTRILKEIGGEKISPVLGVRENRQKLVLLSEQSDYVLSGNTWSVVPRPAQDSYHLKPYTEVIPRFSSMRTREDITKLGEHTIELPASEIPTERFLVCGYPLCDTTMNPDAIPGIYEVRVGDTLFHALPQPDYDTFWHYRPVRVSHGYTREQTKIEEGIGPFQLVGDKVWFGMSFYDGEGTTGVGGLGHFNISTKQFHVRYYPEMADWSASAILVEDRYIWLGLFRRPEGAPYSGGLARFDRKHGAFRVIAIPAIVNKILRVGEVLYLATTEGIYFIRGDKLTHLDFVLDVNGTYSLEAKESSLVNSTKIQNALVRRFTSTSAPPVEY